MTKQEAIKNHRKMWNWIADKMEEEKRKVWKEEYFEAMEIVGEDIPKCECYCCEYAEGTCCRRCPIDWESNCDEFMCFNKFDYRDDLNLFGRWIYTADWNWQEAAKLAREIAQLPERSDVE